MDRKSHQNRDQSVPNRASNMEPAEGSRETVRGERWRDAGRTMGGGNLGHGRERDAVMPDDEESSLNTKI